MGNTSPAAEVERRYGRCALRFQRCEHLAKVFVAHHSLAGPLSGLEEIRAARIERTATTTFGTVAGELLRNCVVPDVEPSPDLLAPHEEILAASFSVRVVVPPAEHARLEAETRALVGLRNDLTHHFLVQHDLATPEGCLAACAVLAQLETRIDAYLAVMDSWGQQLIETRDAAAAFIGSEVFREWVVNGVAPDGTVDWPSAGCVRALQEAAAVLAVEGWTRLDKAVTRMAERSPEQTPQRYSCKRWREVLHKSGQFRVVYRNHPEEGRNLWFQPLQRLGNSSLPRKG